MNLEKNYYFKCKSGLLSGHSYASVTKVAWRIYNRIKSKSKRRTYVRSAYFRNEKIFMDNFWPHLKQKSQTDQKRRLKWFACALELIQKSKIPPAYEHKNCIKQEILYRFIGEYEKQYFVVQIKEELKRKQKFLMSVFGYDLREK